MATYVFVVGGKEPQETVASQAATLVCLQEGCAVPLVPPVRRVPIQAVLPMLRRVMLASQEQHGLWRSHGAAIHPGYYVDCYS
jgi:hypothetical protein